MNDDLQPLTDPDGRHPLRDEAHAWLLRLTSGEATGRDAEAFRQWCARSTAHAAAFRQVHGLWQALGPAAERLALPAAPVIPLPSRRIGRRAFLGGAIAASVALVMLRPALHERGDYSTAVGEQRRIKAGEGLVLELNTDTRIKRQATGAGRVNLEVLEGEVDVLARVPVRILAAGGTVDAQGARFNLRAREGQVCVTCLAGNLSLVLQGHALVLPAGRQLRYDPQQQGEPQPFDAEQVTAWRRQMLVFDDTPLAEVIDEINRYRPGMILLLNAELGQRRVQARFRLDQLAQVAGLIRDAYGARVAELPGGVLLVG